MPSKTNVTFYGGVNEIGGNKILIDDGKTKVFLDFGKSFSQRGQYYAWTDKPRIVNGIGDLVALGIVPDLKGIYRKDLLSLGGLWNSGEEDTSVDAVVLSHAHADHADYISLLREQIQVYMGEMTKEIIETLEGERYSDIEFEITGFKERPIDPKSDDRIERVVHTFKTGKTTGEFTIDSISVEAVHVDHSLPGCYGFIIRTSDSTIVYSGDLRMHGSHPTLTQDFVSRAAESKPDLMLCEGTRIQESTSLTENAIFETFNFFINQCHNSFVFADFSYKDIDRFLTFHKLAKQTNRKLLIDTKTARYIDSLSARDSRMMLPNSKDETIGIYKPRALKYSKEDGEHFSLSNVWTCEDIKKNESKVILTGAGSDELIDIKPTRGLYFHGITEAFDEAGDIDEEMTMNWIRRFGLVKIHSHCSGHASGMELVNIVNRIAPKKIIPIHTECAYMFGTLFNGRVEITQKNQSVEV